MLKSSSRRNTSGQKKLLTLLGLFFMLNVLSGCAPKKQEIEQLKPRIVVLTDVSTWETDDQESLVRFLAHADLFEIEAIMFTTGWSHGNIEEFPEHMDIIYNVINAYEQDLPNLMKRSEQTDFTGESGPQKIGYWPSAEYVKSRTMKGSLYRGIEVIGSDNHSEGSNYIIELADEKDERPLWVTVWGGGNTLAQSVWQVQQTRSEDELKSFLNKLRVYTITDQDRMYDGSEGFEVSAHQWLRDEFSEDLFFIWDECAWRYQNGTGRENWVEYEKHIQGHGNLGDEYPKYKYGVEGDTPAFLHILPNGLNNPEETTQAGWGGYSDWGITPDSTTYAYTNHDGEASVNCFEYEEYFYPATFNNFAARMDWANEGIGNKNPVAIIDGNESLAILTKKVNPGSEIRLDASLSYDPDGDQLSFKWWVMKESGTYRGEGVEISNADSKIATVNVPGDSEETNFHIILEVTDNGTPELTSYRRVIFKSKN